MSSINSIQTTNFPNPMSIDLLLNPPEELAPIQHDANNDDNHEKRTRELILDKHFSYCKDHLGPFHEEFHANQATIVRLSSIPKNKYLDIATGAKIPYDRFLALYHSHIRKYAIVMDQINIDTSNEQPDNTILAKRTPINFDKCRNVQGKCHIIFHKNRENITKWISIPGVVPADIARAIGMLSTTFVLLLRNHDSFSR